MGEKPNFSARIQVLRPKAFGDVESSGSWPRALHLRGLLAGLAVLSVFWVFLINGRPLFYFDTVGFIDQGTIMLRQVGLIGDNADAPGSLEAGLPDSDGDGNVSGSRAAAYALLLATMALLGALPIVVAMNAATAAFTVWLPARVLAREGYLRLSPLATTSLALVAGGLTSLPFVVAFLLPDILTGALVALLALLAVFVQRMRRWEIALALVFLITAVVTHLSHLALATLGLPVVIAVALLVGGPRWWLAPLLAAFVVTVGYAERLAFRVSVETVTDAEVVYYPFMTARLIVDGPGYTYLERNCPDPEIATCALWEALSWSDDPYRLTPSHIIFETSKRLGSYRLMSPRVQGRVAHAQQEFFLAVAADNPVGVIASFLRNTVQQVAMFNIYQTIPERYAVLRATEDLPPGVLDSGRLNDPALGDRLEPLHALVYAIALAIIAWRVLSPLPGPVRLFVIVTLLGLFGNAFVCGAVSQPADRYGARVIWLLPVLAIYLLLVPRGRGPA